MATKEICFIIGSLGLGGAESHLANICPELKKQGFKPRVILLTDFADLKPHFIKHGIQVDIPKYYMHPKPFIPRIFRIIYNCSYNCCRLIKDFIKNRTAIRHFFLPEAYILGMFCALITRLPAKTIMSRRSLNYYQQKSPLYKKLEMFLHKKVNFILTNANKLKQQLTSEEKAAEDKVEVIYNGINCDKFAPNEEQKTKIRQELKINTTTKVIIIVANLIPYKGHIDLIEALAIVNNSNQNWKLLVIGADARGILKDLQQLAISLKINDKICWLLQQKNIVPYLAAADIGILCSHEEGFANAILEYMAANLAVIATDVGGNSEAIIHNNSGLITPKKDSKSLAYNILTLLNNDTKLQELATNATTRANKEFSLLNCIQNYSQFYNKIQDSLI